MISPVRLKPIKNALRTGWEWYKAGAVLLVNTVVLFVLLNLALWVVFKVKDTAIDKDEERIARYEKYGPSLVAKAYPEMDRADLDGLMRETERSLRPGYEPFTHLKPRPATGKYVNVDENGFRRTKDQGPWPPGPANLNVFVFGGSTTFGDGVADDQTIASYLQEFLQGRQARPVKVYNCGRPGYYSAQERILFEKLLVTDCVPDVAVFVDGLNDCFFGASQPVLAQQIDQMFWDWSHGKQSANLGALVSELPMTRAAHAVRNRMGSSGPGRPSAPAEAAPSKAKDDLPAHVPGILDRYVRGKKLIEAGAQAYGVKVLFVWQPVPVYKYDLKYHIFAEGGLERFDSVRYGYAAMAQRLEERPKDCSDNFLWLADIQESSRKPLYVDEVHYCPPMCKELADRIGRFLLQRDLLSAASR